MWPAYVALEYGEQCQHGATGYEEHKAVESDSDISQDEPDGRHLGVVFTRGDTLELVLGDMTKDDGENGDEADKEAGNAADKRPDGPRTVAPNFALGLFSLGRTALGVPCCG